MSTIDLGTPVVCCIPIDPERKTAKKNEINGVNAKLLLTIKEATYHWNQDQVQSYLKRIHEHLKLLYNQQCHQ